MSGLVTLTPQQFLKTGAARRGGTYKNYLRYLANHRGQHPAAPPDPYSALIGSAPPPLTAQQIQQRLGQYTQGMPGSMTPDQIQSEAGSMISPLVAAVTSSINSQAQHASDAVRGYTADLAAKLAGMNFAAPYLQGEQAQAATDTALHDALAGAGGADAAALGKRLAVINDPAVAAAGADVAANGTANANANLALGTDAMSNLIANAAAAGSFGQKLPGIAQLRGLQQLAGIGQNATNQIASQTQQLEGQLPSIIQSLTSTSDANATNKAQARQQLLQYLFGVNENRSGDLLKLKENQIARGDAIDAGIAKNTTALDIANTKAANTAAATDAKNAKPNAALSKAAGYWVDGNGNPIVTKNGTLRLLPGYTQNADGTVVKAGTTKTGGKGMTPSEVNTFLKGLATVQRVPKTDANGNTVLDANNKVEYVTQTQFRLPYAQAYQQLRQAGKTDTEARRALDTVYPKGAGGRSWLTNEQQTVLGNAKVPVATGTIDIATTDPQTGQPIGERHYITQAQATALKRAKLLPPGFWYTADQGHTVYVIKPGY